MLVAVGTTSKLKLRAVRNAFKRLGFDITVSSCETVSGVLEQPFGYEQITTGARNRALRAVELGGEFSIGVENGLIHMESVKKYYDVPAVFVARSDGKSSIAFGAGTVIPHALVDRLQVEKTDLGTLLQSLVGGGEKDPTNYFLQGKLTREDILVETTMCALGELLFPDRYDIAK